MGTAILFLRVLVHGLVNLIITVRICFAGYARETGIANKC